jgi:hypothetical protein
MVSGFPDLVYEAPNKQSDNIEIGPNDISIDLLRAVYRNSALPLHTRMRAAMACLKHEVPALIATAVVNEGSFAEILDRRIARLNEMKLIEYKSANGNEVVTSPTIDPPPTPTPPTPSPLTRIYTNKFRRRF